MLKEIKERHEIVNRVIDDFKGPVIAIRQAHQDRAKLLGLVSAMEDMINCTCSTCSAKKECNFWSKYERLESEAGE